MQARAKSNKLNHFKSMKKNFCSLSRLQLAFGFSLFVCVSAMAQVKTVTGTITERQKPLKNVSVYQEGKGEVAVTNASGQYQILLSGESPVLIGYDYGKDMGWDFDVLFGQYGNPIIGIRIKNIVEQYSADPDNYLNFHTVLNQVVSIIGEGRIVQKLDIFTKKKYQAEQSNQFLQQKYSEHFDGRLFKTIETVLLFTDIIDDKLKKKNKQYNFAEKSYKELRDKCQKVFMLLKQSDCEPQFLFEKEFEYYISGALSMQFSEKPVFDNIKSTNEYLQIGNRFVKNISYVDVENIELPSEVDPYSILPRKNWDETTKELFEFNHFVKNRKGG